VSVAVGEGVSEIRTKIVAVGVSVTVGVGVPAVAVRHRFVAYSDVGSRAELLKVRSD
jgi:hypothetical protein